MTRDGGGSGIPIGAEVWRKALHLLSLLIPVGLVLLNRTTALYVLVPMSLTAVVIEVLRTRSGVVRDLVEKIFGFMMRPEEIPPVPAPVRFNGATWVLVTSTFLVAVFPIPVAAAAIAIGLIGDAAAALVGRTLGRTRIGNSLKTFEGALAFVISTLPIVWIVPGISILAGLVGILTAAVVEALHLPMNDNFSVPVSAAIVMTLLLN
jgi:dolichol kinase